MHLPIGSDHAGHYSTMPLEKTLLELVDFGRIMPSFELTPCDFLMVSALNRLPSNRLA
jgi:hypothetical protein